MFRFILLIISVIIIKESSAETSQCKAVHHIPPKDIDLTYLDGHYPIYMSTMPIAHECANFTLYAVPTTPVTHKGTLIYQDVSEWSWDDVIEPKNDTFLFKRKNLIVQWDFMYRGKGWGIHRLCSIVTDATFNDSYSLDHYVVTIYSQTFDKKQLEDELHKHEGELSQMYPVNRVCSETDDTIHNKDSLVNETIFIHGHETSICKKVNHFPRQLYHVKHMVGSYKIVLSTMTHNCNSLKVYTYESNTLRYKSLMECSNGLYFDSYIYIGNDHILKSRNNEWTRVFELHSDEKFMVIYICGIRLEKHEEVAYENVLVLTRKDIINPSDSELQALTKEYDIIPNKKLHPVNGPSNPNSNISNYSSNLQSRIRSNVTSKSHK